MSEYVYIPTTEEVEKHEEQKKVLRIYYALRKHKVILKLAADGYNVSDIGKVINRSPRTVEAQFVEVCRITGARNRANLIAIAFRKGIIE